MLYETTGIHMLRYAVLSTQARTHQHLLCGCTKVIGLSFLRNPLTSFSIQYQVPNNSKKSSW